MNSKILPKPNEFYKELSVDQLKTIKHFLYRGDIARVAEATEFEPSYAYTLINKEEAVKVTRNNRAFLNQVITVARKNSGVDSDDTRAA